MDLDYSYSAVVSYTNSKTKMFTVRELGCLSSVDLPETILLQPQRCVPILEIPMCAVLIVNPSHLRKLIFNRCRVRGESHLVCNLIVRDSGLDAIWGFLSCHNCVHEKMFR